MLPTFSRIPVPGSAEISIRPYSEEMFDILYVSVFGIAVSCLLEEIFIIAVSKI